MPTSVAAGATVTASYSATDLSSSTLASAQLLRAPNANGQPGTWAAVGAAQTFSGNGPTPVTLEDTPPAGIYWYGTKLIDAAGNVSMQPQAIEVMVSGTTASPSFSVSGTAVSVMPGATTGNTSTISVTPAGGFTGAVALSASVTSGPTGAVQPPTLSFGNTATVSITGTSVATATLTVSTTAPQGPDCFTSSQHHRDFPWFPASGSALALSLFFFCPEAAPDPFDAWLDRARWSDNGRVDWLCSASDNRVLNCDCSGHNSRDISDHRDSNVGFSESADGGHSDGPIRDCQIILSVVPIGPTLPSGRPRQ